MVGTEESRRAGGSRPTGIACDRIGLGPPGPEYLAPTTAGLNTPGSVPVLLNLKLCLANLPTNVVPVSHLGSYRGSIGTSQFACGACTYNAHTRKHQND